MSERPDPTAPTAVVFVEADPDRVFGALADPRTYPDWLVGARRIRKVDDAWPAPGASFHHTVGVGPAVVHDETSIIDIDPPHELRLRAGMGPLGSAVVRFALEPHSRGTRVELTEEPEDGVVRLTWSTLGRPLMALGVWGRNAASLERLQRHLEG